jgi:hypothetical protein
MGRKPSDRYTVPLCRRCHDRQHQVGEVTFWGQLGIDPVDFSTQLWRMSGQHDHGLRTVLRAHQAIELKRRQDGRAAKDL